MFLTSASSASSRAPAYEMDRGTYRSPSRQEVEARAAVVPFPAREER